MICMKCSSEDKGLTDRKAKGVTLHWLEEWSQGLWETLPNLLLHSDSPATQEWRGMKEEKEGYMKKPA